MGALRVNLGSPWTSPTSPQNLRTRRQCPPPTTPRAGKGSPGCTRKEEGRGGAGTCAFRLPAPPGLPAAPTAPRSPLADPGGQRSERALTCSNQWPVSPMSGKPMEPLGMGSLQLLSRVAAQRSCHSCCDTASSSVTDTRHAARVASADTSSKPSKSMLAAARGIGCAGRGGGGEGRMRRDASGGGGEAAAGGPGTSSRNREGGRGRGQGPREGEWRLRGERREGGKKLPTRRERRHEATRSVTLFVCLFVPL